MLWCLDLSLKVLVGVILLPATFFFPRRPDWDQMKVSDKYFQTVIFRSNNFIPLSLFCTGVFGFCFFVFYIWCNTNLAGKHKCVLIAVASSEELECLLQICYFLPSQPNKMMCFARGKGTFPINAGFSTVLEAMGICHVLERAQICPHCIKSLSLIYKIAAAVPGHQGTQKHTGHSRTGHKRLPSKEPCSAPGYNQGSSKVSTRRFLLSAAFCTRNTAALQACMQRGEYK